MGVTQAQRYCRTCKRHTLHEKWRFASTWGCLLTVLTGGLFLLVWLAVKVYEKLTARYHCQVCGG